MGSYTGGLSELCHRCVIDTHKRLKLLWKCENSLCSEGENMNLHPRPQHDLLSEEFISLGLMILCETSHFNR